MIIRMNKWTKSILIEYFNALIDQSRLGGFFLASDWLTFPSSLYRSNEWESQLIYLSNAGKRE